MNAAILIDLIFRTVLLGVGWWMLANTDFWKGAALVALSFLWSISTYLFRLLQQASK